MIACMPCLVEKTCWKKNVGLKKRANSFLPPSATQGRPVSSGSLKTQKTTLQQCPKSRSTSNLHVPRLLEADANRASKTRGKEKVPLFLFGRRGCIPALYSQHEFANEDCSISHNRLLHDPIESITAEHKNIVYQVQSSAFKQGPFEPNVKPESLLIQGKFLESFIKP